MTHLSYSPEKGLGIGFGAAFAAFALAAVVVFNAQRISQNLALSLFIIATLLAWVGVFFLHRETFCRQ
ncbi:MAG: hypothetical protein IJ770_03370 [Alphaproteobacteria bacterium]|nr:hypothetical protein [Alphaproteobacteria bacterium]